MQELDRSFRSMLREAVASPLSLNAEAKVLLLSCIDYRYPRSISETMEEEGYSGRYYHLAMAGASHAGNSAAHSGVWHKTLFDHLGFAVEEAKVAGIVIIDHLDCKAFHLYEGVPVGDLEAERKRHVEVATELAQEIVERFPKLTGNVKVFLLPKESTVDRIVER
jgi:carbonic anhydrase